MIKADKLAKRVNVATPAENASDRTVAFDTGTDFPAMTLNFHNSGQLITTTKIGNIDSEKIGQWRMLKFDPPSTMTIQCFFKDFDADGRELEVTWTDDQTIRLTPPNMSGQKLKMSFKKH